MNKPDIDTEENVRIAVLDDDPRSLSAVAGTIRLLKCDVQAYSDSAAFIKSLDSTLPDILITDLRMPGMDGLAVLEYIRKHAPTTDVIILSGSSNKDDAIRALRLGAFDFFEKPIDGDNMIAAIKRTVRYRTVVQERNRYADQLSFISRQEARRWGIGAFIGKSAAVKKVIADIEMLQRSAQTSVLINGESGTGKELVARAIHFGSQRSVRPFVPVNCSAIPAELAESTLFGHSRGSFTGAIADREGCFATADGGTIFLDEIGDMPHVVQIKLLRVLEDGLVVPVGKSIGRTVDVRVIAATNADLSAKIAAGTFRSDLLYRLAAFNFIVPPLRERKADIPLLADHFARLLSAEMGIAKPVITDAALAALREHDFPGNIRELKNMIERALLESAGRPVGVEHLHFLRIGSIARSTAPSAATSPGIAPAAGAQPSEAAGNELPLNMAEAERALICRAMAKADGNLAAAARLLGLSRAKLYRKLATLSIGTPGK